MIAKAHAMTAVLVGAWLLLPGCDQAQPAATPKNLIEYREQEGTPDRLRPPDHRVIRYNFVRVQNDNLTEEERVESLKLAQHLVRKTGHSDATSMNELASLLRDPQCPPELHRATLIFLLEQKHPGLGPYVIELGPKLEEDPEIRQLVLDYLGNTPVPQMLSSLVKAWAQEPQTTGPAEENYRQYVQQVTDLSWDAALLRAINTPDFEARPEAMEILARRMDRATLAERLRNTSAKTDDMVALQSFLKHFEYLPKTREEYLSTVILYKARRDMIPDASRLSLNWSRNDGYNFNIRDFHLLSRLARDPLRSDLKRTQLVLELGKIFKTRRHVAHEATSPGADDDYKEDFWLQVDELTMADLWNLYLLNEMLSRPRVQLTLKVLGVRDRTETRGVLGGLVFYMNGQAEADLYAPNLEAGNDLQYIPPDNLITDSRDALCRFIPHFEKISNADRAGPTREELQSARVNNYYGLILTQINENEFCAHYFNPEGVVVSLGVFPLREAPTQ